MLRQITTICSVVCVLLFCGLAYPAQQDAASAPDTVTVDVVTISIEKQFDAVKPGTTVRIGNSFPVGKGLAFLRFRRNRSRGNESETDTFGSKRYNIF